jgi:hypothetical protein
MKRITLFIIAVVLCAGPSALAQSAKAPAKPAGVGPNFTDANGDGVCDNMAARGTGRMGRHNRNGMGRGAARVQCAAGAGLAFGRNGESLVDVTARVTGVSSADVLQALKSGRTFEQIAQEHGKSAQDLVQAALSVRQEMVSKAVADGRLTQAQADQAMERMKSRLDQRVSAAWQPQGRGACGRCAMGASTTVSK